jgi:hypothetical protein
VINDDQIDFDGDTGAYTTSMPTLKVLLNAVVFKLGGKFATIAIEEYYLCTPFVDKHGKLTVEFMRIKLNYLEANDYIHAGDPKQLPARAPCPCHHSGRSRHPSHAPRRRHLLQRKQVSSRCRGGHRS